MSAEKRARVVEILRQHEEEMEGYAYYSSNRGVPKDEYEEIAEEIVTALTPQWSEISTAPRDGSMILAWDGVDMAVVKWDGHQFGLVFTGAYAEDNFFGYVTHWLPLPAPPEGEV